MFPDEPGRAHHGSTPQPVTSRTGYLLHSTWGTRTRSGPLGYVSLMGCAFTSPCPLGRGGDNGSHETCPCLMVSFTRLGRRSRRRFRSSCGRSPSLPPPSSTLSSLPLHKETVSSACLTSLTSRGEPHPHPRPHKRHGCHALPSGLPRDSRRTSWKGKESFPSSSSMFF